MTFVQVFVKSLNSILSPQHYKLTMAAVAFQRDIITQLYADGSYFDMCLAAGQQDRIGTPINVLLQELQENYPDADWTLSALLTLLLSGKHTGLYKQNCLNEDNWFVYNGMIKVNYSNRQYADISSMICIPRYP